MDARRRSAVVLHGLVDPDRPDEADTLVQAEAVAGALRRGGWAVETVAVGLDISALERLALAKPCAVFNLVEAIDGDGRLIHLVPMVLEHLGVLFTGAGSEALYLSTVKPLAKRFMRGAELPTPEWSEDGRGLPAGAPVIVKSCWEHASLGMDEGSIVAGDRAATEVAAREARFGGRFFAEAFVAGREFNLSVLEGPGGPEVLPPAEIDFAAFPEGRIRIVDYAAKWAEGTFAFENTPRRFDFPASDEALLAQLRSLALAVWKLFGLRGYARVDFRVDAMGRPWILEVNANPCLSPDAGFVAAAARAGIDFDGLIARIAAVATEPALQLV